jgi:hypothetical protein
MKVVFSRHPGALRWFDAGRHTGENHASGTAVASPDPNWIDAMSFRPFTSESYAHDDRPEAWRDVLGAARFMTGTPLRRTATRPAWR